MNKELELAREEVENCKERIDQIENLISQNQEEWSWDEREFWLWSQNDEGLYYMFQEAIQDEYARMDILADIVGAINTGQTRVDPDMSTLAEHVELLARLASAEEDLAEAEEALEELLKEQAEAEEEENDD